MHIVEVYNRYLPGLGGIEIDMHEVGKRLVQRGHRVDVITIGDASSCIHTEEEINEGVRIHRLSPWGPESLSVVKRFRLTLGKLRPDILHVYSFLPVFLTNYALLQGKMRDIPLVISPIYHPSRLELPKFLEGKKRLLALLSQAIYEKRIGLHLLRMATALRCLTEEERRYFSSLGVEKMYLIPSGVDIHDCQANSNDVENFRRIHGLPENQTIFLFVGSSAPRKGLRDLLKAVALLKKRHQDFVVLIAGGQIVHKGRSKALQAEALDERIRYVGTLDFHALQCSYDVADAVVVPSRYEAFSRVVIEAWAHGKPVIATSAVGLAREIQNHRLGQVVPPADHEQLAKAMEAVFRGANGQEIRVRARNLVMEKYEWGKIVRSMEDLYVEVLR